MRCDNDVYLFSVTRAFVPQPLGDELTSWELPTGGMGWVDISSIPSLARTLQNTADRRDVIRLRKRH